MEREKDVVYTLETTPRGRIPREREKEIERLSRRGTARHGMSRHGTVQYSTTKTASGGANRVCLLCTQIQTNSRYRDWRDGSVCKTMRGGQKISGRQLPRTRCRRGERCIPRGRSAGGDVR
jgi:hypothetical protein